MLGAIGRPYRKQVMIGVLEGAAATHSDEPGVSLLWQYHSLVPTRSFCPTYIRPKPNSLATYYGWQLTPQEMGVSLQGTDG